MIGKLRHKIKVFTPTIPSSFGFDNSVITRTNHFETFASLSEVSRKSKIDSGLDGVAVTYEVIIRGVSSGVVIGLDQTIEWDNKTFSVLTTPTLINLNNKMYYKFLMVQRDE